MEVLYEMQRDTEDIGQKLKEYPGLIREFGRFIQSLQEEELTGIAGHFKIRQKLRHGGAPVAMIGSLDHRQKLGGIAAQQAKGIDSKIANAPDGLTVPPRPQGERAIFQSAPTGAKFRRFPRLGLTIA